MKNEDELFDSNGIELDEGDCGVVFRADGKRIGFSDSPDPTNLDLRELYDDEPTPQVLAALALVLAEDDEKVKKARAILADWLMENVINDGPVGTSN